ncbi:MAG TPA: PilN domain-containing protein [Candidatus Binatia bacterium]
MMNALQQLKDLSRADFLRSVGLYFLRDRVVMVRLRKSFLNVSMVEIEERELPQSDNQQAISELTGWVADDVKEIALKAENDSRERALRQAMVSLLPHFDPARDSVYVCVPQEQAIVQQVFLPLAAADNLQQVLEYEIERQLPFKRDEIYFDYLPVGPKGDKFSVYVFAVLKKNLTGLLTLLESFDIHPKGVESTASALANYLLFAAQNGTESCALVAGHRLNWELIGVKAKSSAWKGAPQLLFAHQFSNSGWALGSGQELLQECLWQVPNRFSCGDLTALNGFADSESAKVQDLVGLEPARLKKLKPINHAEALPALGAALRGVREATLELNFLHPDGAERGRGQSLSVLNTVLFGLLVIAMIGWAVSFPIKDELRLRQLQQANQKLEPSIDALRREETQLEQLRKETNILTEFDQKRGEVLRVLDELSKVVPNNAYFSNLRYRAGVLEAQGNAESASALIPLLERSQVFENVGFNAPSNRGRDNRETFSLKADLEKAKEPAKTTSPQPTKETRKEPVKTPALETKSKS